VIRDAEMTAVATNNRVTIVGEMVAVLWAEEKFDATIRLEQLCNDLARTHSFHLLCAYPASGFRGEQMGQPYAAICAQHSAVIPTKVKSGSYKNNSCVLEKSKMLQRVFGQL
jgi:hypothetical protein